jgi:DNA-binding HxlR family transcriptional regulator
MARPYIQYCPVAHSLELVGERWSLLIVRDLLKGPKRYSDLLAGLPGLGSNILAARLKELEEGAIIRKTKLPPPANVVVYELTEYGAELKPVLHELAHWGARSLGPPLRADVVEPGWLAGALRIALPPTTACIEFRIGDEVAFVAGGDAAPGPAENPEAVVEGDVSDFYRLLVDRELEAVTVRGRKAAVRELLETLPPYVAAPAAAPVVAA